MKRVVICISFLIAMMNNLSAQSVLNDLRFKKIVNDDYHNRGVNPEIQGTPYLDKEFSLGKVITRDGTISNDVSLRYNGYTDDLEFMRGKDSYNIDPKSVVKRAEFGGKVFTCMDFSLDGKINNGFFEILTEGKATLLVRYVVKFLEKEVAKPFEDQKAARFAEIQKSYFLTLDGNPAQKITGKRDLIELFGSRKHEIDSYISKNKLSIKKDDDMTKIVAHYNSL